MNSQPGETSEAGEAEAQAPEQQQVPPRTYGKLGLATALLALLIDQGNKLWLLFGYDIGAKTPVTVTRFFDVILVWNRGISYGLLQQGSNFGRWLLILFALGVCIGLALWLTNVTAKLPAMALGLIIGGALGNAIDRMLYGAVADFYSLHAFGFEWYVFNFADCAVVAGVIGLLYDSLFGNHKKVLNPSKM